MESKNCASLALFLALNLLFFSMVTACGRTCPNPPKPKPTPNPTPGTPTPGTGTPGTPGTGTPGTGTPGTGTPTPGTGTPGTPGTGTPGTGTPTPGTGTPTPTPSSRGRCPRDALKLGVCANVLGLINVVIGSPPTLPCCSLLQGLANLEAAICLCTAIRANILGINLNIPISLSLLLNTCGRTLPSGFQC